MNTNDCRLVPVGHHSNRMTTILHGKHTAGVILLGIGVLIALAAAVYYLTSFNSVLEPKRPVGLMQETALAEDHSGIPQISEAWVNSQRQWYVAPGGKASAAGTIETPWDLGCGSRRPCGRTT